MISLSQAQWVRTLAVFAFATFVFEIISTADNIIAGDLGGFSMEVLVLVCVAVSTLFLFGILWSWAGKQYGYIIVGLIALLYFVVVYVSHVFGISDAREFAQIAKATPEGWSPLFVASPILTGIGSLATVIIAVYLLVKARQSA